MHPSYSKIVSLSTDRNIQGLQSTYTQLLVERMKLDKFFDMFLDKFHRKMDSETQDSPIRKLYNSKSKEYSELQRTITIAEYYMKKHYV